ncbi:hypothetical protein HMF3257_35940 [Spirosoma telluris]|uniref:Uncharacterized protein n=1 Tax=Spirosoma telluris TaxID=2183553 RepID=A0A327NVV5_9BACT|nr:hypothetical protein HMF3257_35940 [Spirosoma telluris]
MLRFFSLRGPTAGAFSFNELGFITRFVSAWLNGLVLHLCFLQLTFGRMSVTDSSPTPYPEDELDDPYVHTVSTEEFVEIIEQASQEETD